MVGEAREVARSCNLRSHVQDFLFGGDRGNADLVNRGPKVLVVRARRMRQLRKPTEPNRSRIDCGVGGGREHRHNRRKVLQVLGGNVQLRTNGGNLRNRLERSWHLRSKVHEPLTKLRERLARFERGPANAGERLVILGTECDRSERGGRECARQHDVRLGSVVQRVAGVTQARVVLVLRSGGSALSGSLCSLRRKALRGSLLLGRSSVLLSVYTRLENANVVPVLPAKSRNLLCVGGLNRHDPVVRIELLLGNVRVPRAPSTTTPTGSRLRVGEFLGSRSLLFQAGRCCFSRSVNLFGFGNELFGFSNRSGCVNRNIYFIAFVTHALSLSVRRS